MFSFLETVSLTKSVEILESKTEVQNTTTVTQDTTNEHTSDVVVLNLLNTSDKNLINTTGIFFFQFSEH